MSRKALRLYENAGILPSPRRTAAGYRVFGSDAVALLAFVSQARRLGFRLEEIREIVAIKRAGGALARTCESWSSGRPGTWSGRSPSLVRFGTGSGD